MDIDETQPELEALRYLRAWCKDTYDQAEQLLTLAIREHDDDSSTDAVRARFAEEARQTENLAGRLGEVVELLERGLAEQRKRRQVVHWRFADAGAWAGDDDGAA